MASDEKMGFCVGLVFIFVVALVLNSLSRFGKATGNSELTTAMVSRPLGIRSEATPAPLPPEPAARGSALEASLPSKDWPDTQHAQPRSQYVVREGDTLWRIAASQLGDGRRYEEISRLNGAVLQDRDSLVVGMRLIMPAR